MLNLKTNNKMKTFSMVILCTLLTTINLFAQGLKAELDKSQKAGKTSYLVVYDKSSTGTEALVNIAKNAQKSAKNTLVIKFDRDDKANTDLVTKYRLSAVPLPLILVVAPNGVVSAGVVAKDATAEKLVSFVPSKNQADVLLGFESGKAALVICGKKNAKDKAAIISECKTAITSLGGKANQVFVDLDSKDEANFITLLNPDKTKTTVLVFNGKGQFTGVLESTAKSEDILKAVNKKIGGCAPGSCGSGKKC